MLEEKREKACTHFFFSPCLLFFFPFSPSFLLFFPPLSLSLFSLPVSLPFFFSYFPHCFAPFHSFTPLPRLSGRERARAVPGERKKGKKRDEGAFLFKEFVCLWDWKRLKQLLQKGWELEKAERRTLLRFLPNPLYVRISKWLLSFTRFPFPLYLLKRSPITTAVNKLVFVITQTQVMRACYPVYRLLLPPTSDPTFLLFWSAKVQPSSPPVIFLLCPSAPPFPRGVFSTWVVNVYRTCDMEEIQSEARFKSGGRGGERERRWCRLRVVTVDRHIIVKWDSLVQKEEKGEPRRRLWLSKRVHS